MGATWGIVQGVRLLATLPTCVFLQNLDTSRFGNIESTSFVGIAPTAT